MGCSCLRERKDFAKSTLGEKKKGESRKPKHKNSPIKLETPSTESLHKTDNAAAVATNIVPDSDIDLRLRAPDQVLYIKKPLAAYYKLTADFLYEPSLRLTKAQNLVTEQPCLILYKPAGLKVNASKAEERRYSWKLWCSLDSPHVLKTYECMINEQGEYWVFEDYDGGDAEEWLHTAGGAMPESLVMRVMFQVFAALNYIHSKGIVIRNLNLKSLVFPQAISDTCVETKLGYFFHACESKTAKQLPPFARKSPFLSPEARAGYSGPECDLWSCGVLLYYLLSGTSPFPSFQDPADLEAVIGNKIKLVSPCWLQVTEEARALVTGLLNLKKEARPSLHQCLSSPCVLRHAHRRNLANRGIRRTLTSITGTVSRSAIRQAVLELILKRVVKKESLTLLSDTFKALDTNYDGRISRDELLVGMRKVHSEPEATRLTEEVMKSADTDCSGSIDYSEFLMTSFREEKLLSSENMKKAFLSFDRDNSGKISLEELKDALVLKQGANREKVWLMILRGADMSGDGEIDYAEFQAMIESALQ